MNRVEGLDAQCLDTTLKTRSGLGVLRLHCCFELDVRMAQLSFQWFKLFSNTAFRERNTALKTMTKLKRIFDGIRSVKGDYGRVTASCADCGSKRSVSARAWSGDSKPECLCGKPMYHAHPEQLVTVIATFHNGKRVDAKPVRAINRRIKKPRSKDLPEKPAYTNQPRESSAIKPVIVLKPRGDYEPTQKWRRNDGA